MKLRDRVCGIIGCLTVVILLPVSAQTASSTPAQPSPDQAAAQAKLATSVGGPTAVTDPRQDGLVESETRLSAIRAKYPSVAGGATWSMGTQTLTINVVGSVNDLQSPTAALAQEIQAAAFPYTIRFQTVPIAASRLQAVAEKMMATKDQWATGIPGMAYIVISEVDGSIIVGVDQAYAHQWQTSVSKAVFELPVIVRPESQSAAIPQ